MSEACYSYAKFIKFPVMNCLMAVEVIDGTVLHFPQMMRGGTPKEGAACKFEEQARERALGAAAQRGTTQTDMLEAGICLE